MPKPDEEWDPRYDKGFWTRVAIAAGVPPAVVLGVIFAPGATMAIAIAYAVRTLPRLFKSGGQIEKEQAENWTRAVLRREILRAKMKNPDVQVTTWMRVVRAYYELTASNDPKYRP